MQIQLMWNTKCFVIPVISGATGMIIRGPKNIWKQNQKTFNR